MQLRNTGVPRAGNEQTWTQRVIRHGQRRPKAALFLLALLVLALLSVFPTLKLSRKGRNAGQNGHEEKNEVEVPPAEVETMQTSASCPSSRPCPECQCAPKEEVKRRVEPDLQLGEYPFPLAPLRAYFGSTPTEKRCDQSHSLSLIRQFRDNNNTYCGLSKKESSHMHCLEAEGCVVCRGRNLVVDFSKISPRIGHNPSNQGHHRHLNYQQGAFGMSCDFNRRIVSGRGYAHLLTNMWKTWTSYDEQDCDIIVEHPVIFVVRFEAWNLWHQLGDWFCMFVSNLALGVDPQVIGAQVIFFDTHEPSRLVEPFGLFSPHDQARRALIDTEWNDKKVCFRDAIFPYEGYGAVFERHGDHSQVGDPCQQSDLVMSFGRWMLNQYGLLTEQIAATPAITLIVRKNPTGERKRVERQLGNEEELVSAINNRISEVYSKHGNVPVNVVDLVELPFREQLKLMFSKTNILIGVHGAGLAHLLFLPPEAVVIELVPPGWKNMLFFRNLAKQTGKVYLTVPMQGDNNVMIDDFVKTLDAAVAITRSFDTNFGP